MDCRAETAFALLLATPGAAYRVDPATCHAAFCEQSALEIHADGEAPLLKPPPLCDTSG